MKQDQRCYLQLTRISNINHQRIWGGVKPGRMGFLTQSELSLELAGAFSVASPWVPTVFTRKIAGVAGCSSDSDGRSTMYQPSAIRIETNKEDVNGKMCNDLDVYQSTMMGVYIYIPFKGYHFMMQQSQKSWECLPGLVSCYDVCCSHRQCDIHITSKVGGPRKIFLHVFTEKSTYAPLIRTHILLLLDPVFSRSIPTVVATFCC